ncbi:hypothetical protein [Treponema sp. OMZ 857]|uniref:hypothetical protein n=1 Tax=Treponema sp. OMZ 857 TaxID=1643513 RepID=UPI0020A4C8F5|nr:hypothetical protein [Treponema sp. OMZ 857]UTC44739.1 hypothetical protein E4N66_11980 [Treponema sp. OMZ 857]
MKGFILTLVGDILLINGAIISTVGSKLVGNPDPSNISLQTVLSGSFGGTALTFLILACEVILTGLVFSIIGLIGNIKRNEKKVFNILGILLGAPLILLSAGWS